MNRDTSLTKFISSLLGDFRFKSVYVLMLIMCAELSLPGMGRAALPPEPAPALGGLFLAPKSELGVDLGRIDLDCTDLGRSLDQGITRGTCRLNGQWTISNHTQTEQSAKGFILSHLLTKYATSAQPASVTPSRDALQRFCKDARYLVQYSTEVCIKFFTSPEEDSSFAVHGFALSLKPGESQEIEIKGAIEIKSMGSGSWLWPGALVRHIFIGNYRGQRFYRFGVFAGDSPIDLTLRSSGDRVKVNTPNDKAPDDNTQVLASGSNTIQVPKNAKVEIMHDQLFSRGGPIIGLGSLNRASAGFAARLGYQVYAPRWVQLELSMDTNFDDVFVVSPTVEMISSSFMGLPSLGLGLGVPVQLETENSMGLRLQFSAMIGALGFVGSVDFYEGEERLSARTRWTLLCQISL